MSRLIIAEGMRDQQTVQRVYGNFDRRIIAAPPGLCPVDLTLNYLRSCHAQSCGKCVPCRVGLGQLVYMMRQILVGKCEPDILTKMERLATDIYETADCAIGFEAAKTVLKDIRDFRDDFMAHIEHNSCYALLGNPVPCKSLCPAHVDIPGYVALVKNGRNADAVRLIMKDNPFPTACAFVCEHPCEEKCRRKIVDDAINIRGIKRHAVDNSGVVNPPENMPETGKKIAIIGGGPSGLTAAYFLSLMGHKCTVYEMKNKLGGMLRYGIPSYRFPRERLDEDIERILKTGVEIKLNTKVGKDISFDEIKKDSDAVYIAIGAHTDRKMGIEGEDSKNVISAVDFLNDIGHDNFPDFTGKNVVVVGGGNVAMDCVRSALRCGADKSYIVYRRRKEDMTALPDEIEGALAEGCEFLELQAPLKVEPDAEGKVAAFWTEPQIIGAIDPDSGRASVSAAKKDAVRIPCDVVIIAIGQSIESKHFAEAGVPTNRGKIAADDRTIITEADGVFSGGDCASGPATVIKAIMAGKVAAANIDEYLGFNHLIESGVEVPEADLEPYPPTARVNLSLTIASERSKNFSQIENAMSDEECQQECSRCLRCDHYGYGIFKGGREFKW